MSNELLDTAALSSAAADEDGLSDQVRLYLAQLNISRHELPTMCWKGNAAFHHALRTMTSPRHGTEDITARRRLYVSGSADAHDIRLLTRPWFTCLIQIQTGITFLVLAYPDCPGKEAAKWVCL